MICLWYSSEECTDSTAAPLGVYTERITALATIFLLRSSISSPSRCLSVVRKESKRTR
jgi:hypothetical protein